MGGEIERARDRVVGKRSGFRFSVDREGGVEEAPDRLCVGGFDGGGGRGGGRGGGFDIDAVVIVIFDVIAALILVVVVIIVFAFIIITTLWFGVSSET